MKIKIIILVGFLAILHFCVGCGKGDHNINYAGNWINEKNDTIYFYESDPDVHNAGSLIFKNFNPYYTIFYSYNIERDSIFLFPAHSSNLNDWKGYPIQLETNEFVLYQYNNIEKSIYKRIN